MKFKTAYFALTLTLFATASQANDNKGNHAVWGVGQTSCNSYSKARESGSFANYTNFLMGYLTAYNTVVDDNYSVSGKLDLDGVLSSIDEFCRQTPTDSFDHALQIVVSQLRTNRLRKPGSAGQSWGRN